MKIFIPLFVFFVLILAGCYYDSVEYLNPSQYLIPCDTTNFTYSGSVKQILNDNCYSCHSNANYTSGGGFKLENYNDLKVQIDNGQLYKSITYQSHNMPPNGKLQSCKITIIKKWIDAGAPNN
jgi:hypothetical protein